SRAADVDRSFGNTAEILAFLSEFTGMKYPYSVYRQVCVTDFLFGGMENITATTLTPLVLDDELGNLDEEHHDLIAHEAAHQWFGDLITCNDWSHIWLNEGFATYMTELYFEATRGVEEFRARMRNTQEDYMRADVGRARRPTVWNVYKEPDDLFDELVYEGAACRLHLLRFVLGDEVFRDAVRGYVEEYAGRNVDTDDFQRAAEEASGRDLDWFFQQWFHGRGYPEFRFDWEWDEARRTVVVDVEQMQEFHDGTPAVFRTPVEIEVREPAGISLHRLEIDERKERFELAADAKPLYVRFDKHGWIPKGMIWRRSPREWIAIANRDDDVNGRRDAVRALGGIAAEARRAGRGTHEVYVRELVARLRGDPSPYVRLEAAPALGKAGGLEARKRLRSAAGDDPDPRVRVAALDALHAWGESADLARFAREEFAVRFSWNTMAAAAGLVCSADSDGAYDWIVSRLSVESPHDQLAGKLLGHLAGLDDGRVPDRLLAAARNGALHPNARAEAVRGIGKLPKRRITHSRALGELLDVEDFRLRHAVVEALAELKNPQSRRLLEAYYPEALTPTERRAIEGALEKHVGGRR
ncbi:MAG: M1 family aminopeptidase, partial [Planctomycetota bacterium]|nr:M1 family aminopeptidase [Planctomycetota bacterium]